MEPEREGCFYGRPGIFLEEAFSIAVYGRRLLWRMKGRALLLAGKPSGSGAKRAGKPGKQGSGIWQQARSEKPERQDIWQKRGLIISPLIAGWMRNSN